LNVNNEDVIVSLENILKNMQYDGYTPNPMSPQELKNRISQSIMDAEAGKLISSDELLLDIQSWD
jgi:hypothetical protein